MEQSFEYIDESSNQFWEYTWEGTTISIKHGTIGTEGETTKSTYASVEEAKAEFDRVMEEARKMPDTKNEEHKPGSDTAKDQPGYHTTTWQEAEEKYDLAFDTPFEDYQDQLSEIRVYEAEEEGKVHFTDDLYIGYDNDCHIIIDGDLEVEGNIIMSIFEGTGNFMWVTGKVEAYAILLEGIISLNIRGGATIKHGILGMYGDNGGYLDIGGTVTTPVILNSSYFNMTLPGTINGITIDTSYGYLEADFDRQDVQKALIDKLFNTDGNLDQRLAASYLAVGENILRKDAKPIRLVVEEELTRLAEEAEGAKTTSLDLANKKLKAFPETLLQLKNLTKLNLSDNQISDIPGEIARLENLEELYLNECGLQELPAEIGELKKLRVLEVSNNLGTVFKEDQWVHVYLKLPESLGNLSNLKVLRVNYNQGFGFPKTITKLKNLEELEAYNCSDAAPIDFPEEMTQLTGLKRLTISSNSFKTIPASFLNLQNLEELDLNASLCYLSALPDLSTLTKLRVLKANGLINYTTRPKPHQSLLRSFFGITGLEELSIDRHGESKDIFKDAEFRELLGNLAYDPERQAEIKACFQPQEEKNPFYGTIWEGYPRKNLTAQHVEGIGNLKNLKVLDLSFNGLEHLPEEIYTLQHLEKVNLEYNENLAIEDLKRLYETFPKARINGKKIRTRVDIDDENFKKINDLNKHGNLVMRQQNYAQAIETFEEAISLCTPDKKYSDYDELYAHYGVAYSLGQWIPKQPAGKEKDAMIEKLKRVAKKALDELIPADGSIWHYTEEGAFQEECIRMMGNALAWNVYENTT
ncbi:MAG: WGR domain-containing protein, partial [Cytophagales bacterium]|nr:WGR domain-containing protein [Cytophagales bacterium]